MIENKEWQEVGDAPIGHIVRDWFENGIRCLIKKGRPSLCAYLGIPKSHPLAGFNYNDLPLDVHGGLCFSRCITDEDGQKIIIGMGGIIDIAMICLCSLIIRKPGLLK